MSPYLCMPYLFTDTFQIYPIISKSPLYYPALLQSSLWFCHVNWPKTLLIWIKASIWTLFLIGIMPSIVQSLCICWYLSCLFVSTCCTHDESAGCRDYSFIFSKIWIKRKKLLILFGSFLDNLTKQILQIHKLLVVPLELQ